MGSDCSSRLGGRCKTQACVGIAKFIEGGDPSAVVQGVSGDIKTCLEGCS